VDVAIAPVGEKPAKDVVPKSFGRGQSGRERVEVVEVEDRRERQRGTPIVRMSGPRDVKALFG